MRYILKSQHRWAFKMPASKITLHIVVETDEESGWLTASCPALPGCITQAENETDLLENIKEAVALWFEVQDDKEMQARKASPNNNSAIQELALSI